MILHTFWIVRKGFSTPELRVAWDERAVEDIPGGFRQDCQDAIQELGDELDIVRYIDIAVNEDLLMEAFDAQHIEGRIIR